MPRCLVAVVATAALIAAGCGGGPKLVPASGVLLLDKKPLADAQVEFWPETEGPRSIAVTDANGKFVLKTDDQTRDGAVPGPHKVVVIDLKVYEGIGFRPREDTNIREKPSRTPHRLADVNQTSLRATVEEGKPIELNVSSR